MSQKPPNNKITQYRKYSWLNIGTLLFVALLVYMVISIIILRSNKRIAAYEVTAGSISGNYHYMALAIKDEEVIPADYSGSVTYYAREGARAGTGTTICSVSEYSTNAQASAEPLTTEDYSLLRSTIASYAQSYSDSNFQNIYNFKADLEADILQSQSRSADAASVLGAKMDAPHSGFVSYRIDGMEQITENDLSEELFNLNNYSQKNLRLNTSVKAGDDVYKLISGETWTLYVPLSAQLATLLQDRKSIRIRFLKDDATFDVDSFSVIMRDNNYYGKLSLKNSLVRYVSDRYVEIELLVSRKSGLKIPSSSIAEKVFYKVPEDYVIKNEDDPTEVSIIREQYKSDGSQDVRYITTEVYDIQDGGYLISTDVISSGDYIQMNNTTKKRQVLDDDLVTIQGVYNLNKGYAIFRQVRIIDENEEFCIVEPEDIYSLAAHDYIALDASKVRADDIR